MTTTSTRPIDDYQRIERAIAHLNEHAVEQPSLDEIAARAELSPFHFQRLFRRWAGVSPKRFLEYLTVERAKRLLAAEASVLDAAYEVGLSGPARLHDHFVNLEAMSPGEWKRRGRGVVVGYGYHPSPFGRMLLAATDRGVCGLSFESPEAPGEAAAWLAERYPEARLAEDRAGTAELAERLFAEPGTLPLLVRGTNFQVQVWRALLEIPPGRLISYGALARRLGRPTGARAVGTAVGANPVAWVIPCHRVIRGLGTLGGYRWGTARKRAMIGWEAARARAAEAPPPGRVADVQASR